jgi:transcription elongation factor Elf1
MRVQMNEENKNGFVKYHLPCPLCNSSDAVSVNKDNSAYCFSCQQFIKEYDMENQSIITSHEHESKPITNQSDFTEIVDRNIKTD